MLNRIKSALPCSLCVSIVLTLTGIPMGYYDHAGRMAPELLRSFVITFIVYMAVYMFFNWITEKAKVKKR